MHWHPLNNIDNAIDLVNTAIVNNVDTISLVNTAIASATYAALENRSWSLGVSS